jgi:L-lactate dehydrogenase complex protein LldG
MTARDDILGGIRRALKRGPVPAETRRALTERVAAHRRNLVPARAAALDRAARVELFVRMAEEVQTTIARVAAAEDVPEAVARYLAAENLPAELVMAPDPALQAIPWERRPLLHIRRGRAEAADPVSLTACLAAIAETGTLLLVSGAETPTTLNFLPDTHIVVAHVGQVVASYEDGWDLVRGLAGREPQTVPQTEPRALPRTINLITGPSRTGDIEQRIQLGAHGPRRLHVVLVDEPAGANGPAVG